MIDKKRIEQEAEHFFEWPTKDHTYVTRTSMLIFAATIAEMVRKEEQEACERLCAAVQCHDLIGAHPEYMAGKEMARAQCIAAIRARTTT